MSAKADNVHSFTEQYFFDELLRLRQAWGTKDFWNLPEDKRQKMLDGLGFLYLNIVNDDGSKPDKEKIDEWATHYQATMTEYSRRELFIKHKL